MIATLPKDFCALSNQPPPPNPDSGPDAGRSNAKAAAWIVGIVVVMTGLSFASVPLYRLFCQQTGWGGTPQKASASTAAKITAQKDGGTSQRRFNIRFNADHQPNLPVAFHPLQPQTSVEVGRAVLAQYRVTNQSDHPLKLIASYNVTPENVAAYFTKMECFCFKEQHIAAGQSIDLPVSFFMDPQITEQPELADIRTITLSYSFFEVKPKGAQKNPDKG
jgi:cytochrome c oxidase assembly protein subunit 11